MTLDLKTRFELVVSDLKEIGVLVCIDSEDAGREESYNAASYYALRRGEDWFCCLHLDVASMSWETRRIREAGRWNDLTGFYVTYDTKKASLGCVLVETFQLHGFVIDQDSNADQSIWVGFGGAS